MSEPSDGPGVRASAVALGTVGNWSAKFATLAAWFVAVPLLVAHLGMHDFGVWALIQSIVALTGVLDFAVAASLTRDVAVRERGASRTESVAAIWWLSLAYAVIVLVVSAISADSIAQVTAPAESRHIMSRVIALAGAHIAVSLPYAALVAILRGLRRFDLANLATFLTGIGGAAGTTIVAAAGGGLPGVLAVLPVVLCVMVGVSLVLVRRADPDLRLGLSAVQTGSLARMARFAAPVLVAALAARLQTRTGELVVATMFPLTSVTSFAIARRLGEVPQHLIDQFTKVLLPFAAELDAAADQSRLRELYFTAYRLTFAILFPAAALIGVLGRSLLTVWIGPELANSSVLVSVLAMATFVEASQWVAVTTLQAMGRHRPVAVIGIAAAFTSLVLSFCLGALWGPLGIALGALVATLFAALAGIFPMTLSGVGVAPRDLIVRAVWPAAWPLVPAIALAGMIDRWISPPTWTTLVLAGLASMGTYAALFWALGTEPRERRLVRELARRARRVTSSGAVRAE